MGVNPKLCIRCKGGRNLCGLGSCPMLDKIRATFPTPEIKSKEVFGSSPPSIFVGRYGYPKVATGPVLPPIRTFRAERLDSPESWYGKPVEEVIGFRSALLRSKHLVRVTDARNPRGVLQTTQELAMAAKPVDTELRLSKIPKPVGMRFDDLLAPSGPTADVVKARLTENPRIPRKVDALVDDRDAGASVAIFELYDSNIELGHLQRLLTAGLLGRGNKRRLVPTRWGITAVDDTLAKPLTESVKGFQELGEIQLYKGNYVGNYFHILLIPRIWSFELVETWLTGAFWSSTGDTGAEGEGLPPFASEVPGLCDWEGYNGRKSYASETTGAYYAARLGVLEHLITTRRQATAIIVREITEEYWAPLGVWVIRETVRDALKKRPSTFSSLKEAKTAITSEVTNKQWIRKSHLLHELAVQKRLDDYIVEN